jgi:hypothetical protein
MNLRSTSPAVAMAWNTHPGYRQLLRWTLVSAVSVSAATAAFLVARRWAGADQQSLSAVSLIAAGITIAAAAACAHRVWHWSRPAPTAFNLRTLATGSRNRQISGGSELTTAWQDGQNSGEFCYAQLQRPTAGLQPEAWWDALVTLAAVCWAAALSLPGSPVAMLVLVWSLLAGSELAWWWPAVRHAWRRPPADAPVPAGEDVLPESAVPQRAGAEAVEPAPAEETDDLETLPENLRQRMVRGLDERGQEIIYGAVRCDFAAGQRQQEVHLGFCPPLDQVPELSFEQIDGPPAKIHPALVQTFGVCLEIRLPAPSTEPASVQIQFYACPPTGA